MNKVNKVRGSNHKKEGANDATAILGKLPNIIRVPIMGLIKFKTSKGFFIF